MKDIRPSTWATLIILALMIFVPAFFIDDTMIANEPEELGPVEHITPPPPNRRGPQRPDNKGPQQPDNSEEEPRREEDPAGETSSD